ncbi:MAG: rod shape-determining protein MreC [Pseudomonadales bacterium]
MSMVLMTVDVTTRLLEPMRGGVGTFVSPLQLLAEVPYLLADQVGEVASSHETLRRENAELKRRILELSQISQQFLSMKTENERLRALLGSRARVPAEVLVAELVGIVPTVNTHQVIIDKGAESGIEIGQAVLDDRGLFGQIVEVDQFTSRVLLIIDPSHAIPVQVNRSGVRSVAGGTGELHRLELENVPVTADIREGDLMESSGLGWRFPRGYPVGYVSSVIIVDTSPYAQVSVSPLAALDRSRHVLVVFDRERRRLEDAGALESAGETAGENGDGFADPLDYEGLFEEEGLLEEEGKR